ncbi:MAG: SDR family oxidoreductase [Planctomycetota bacterium]
MNWTLVTGVSKGLGLTIARRLLQNGRAVLGLSRSQPEGVKELASKYPDSFKHLTADLGSSEALAESLQNNIPTELRISGLVNNAAKAYDDLASNLDQSQLEAMFRTNVFGAMQLSKFCIRRMLLHKTSGSLVHISSICAHTGYKGLSMYAASKAALEGFSKNLAREWGRMKIRSNCVVPGFMESDMSAGLDSEQKSKIYKRTALNEATSMESVAATVEHLLSENSLSITGQNLVVDSGTI